MGLTSIEYANLIAWLALTKHGVHLGKTQLQKLLFIFYGLGMIKLDKPAFEDDSPKAFPFGPVFPRSYKRYDGEIKNLTDEDKKAFMSRTDALKLAVQVVDEFHPYSAIRLSEWSHRDDGPWKKTVYRDNNPAWGREILKTDIEEYFKRPDWKIGL